MKKKDDGFIMLPTVDFCFKELMQNAKVRQGFIAALLAVEPELVEETELMPTFLSQESADDKLGILDVRVKLSDGTQMDFEMQVASFDYWENRIIFYLSKMCTEQLKKGELYAQLKKCIHVSILNFIHFPEDELQKDISDNSGVYDWMRFFSGKSRKEFEDMAHTDEYIGEACETLKKMSADEKKRLEYEAREKALRDYNSQVKSYYDRGREEGCKEGRKEGRERINSLNLKLAELGRTDDITRAAADDVYQEKLLREFGL